MKKILVADDEDEIREFLKEARRLGADDYITKPLSLDYLQKTVSEKIENLAK